MHDIIKRTPRIIDLRTDDENLDLLGIVALTVSAFTTAGLLYLAVCIFA